jgi:hypothetical protein
MDQPVVVTVLDGREIRRRSQVTNASAWGVGLEMRCALVPGILVRIEFAGAVVLGAVMHCREAAGSYYVGVKLDQALKSLANLAGALDDLARQPADSIAHLP